MTEEKLTEKDYEVLDACCELLSIKIDEIKAENERLKEEIKEVKKYQYQQEYLDKEIAELKAYKDVNEDFKTAWDELKAENERLKEENYQLQKDCQICENFIDFIPCKPIRDMDYDLQKVINQRDKYYQQTLDDEIQINELMQENERLKQTLQEIKKYAESIGNEEMINGYAIRAKSALWRIANKITKAEEE